jgi:hypothetical protein
VLPAPSPVAVLLHLQRHLQQNPTPFQDAQDALADTAVSPLRYGILNMGNRRAPFKNKSETT